MCLRFYRHVASGVTCGVRRAICGVCFIWQDVPHDGAQTLPAGIHRRFGRLSGIPGRRHKWTGDYCNPCSYFLPSSVLPHTVLFIMASGDGINILHLCILSILVCLVLVLIYLLLHVMYTFDLPISSLTANLLVLSCLELVMMVNLM